MFKYIKENYSSDDLDTIWNVLDNIEFICKQTYEMDESDFTSEWLSQTIDIIDDGLRELKSVL